jgi:hypothetical protein
MSPSGYNLVVRARTLLQIAREFHGFSPTIEGAAAYHSGTPVAKSRYGKYTGPYQLIAGG